MRVLLAAIIGLALGAVLIAVTGYSPTEAYTAMFHESLGSVEGVAGVLGTATPLLLVALGFVVAYRAGLFNIGGEGQFVLGALAAAFVGHALRSLPAVALIPLTLAGGILAGAGWAALSGWMKAARNVHEVVSTIMLNYVALHLSTYLVNVQYGPMHDPASTSPQSMPIGAHAMLPTLFPRTDLHAGFLLALAMVPLMAWFMRKSVMGFEIRAVGKNPLAARTYGIPEKRVILRAMAISGALAGLAGAMELMGVSAYAGAFKPDFSAGRGFDGITIALMAGGAPLGVLIASIFLGALRLGATGMQSLSNVPSDLALVVQGILILAVSTPTLSDFVAKFRRARKPEAVEPL
ncbi:MAG TPA: ABC transporter permease [Armatimonadota bacterium]|jgi:simple sugar transport system permease protein